MTVKDLANALTDQQIEEWLGFDGGFLYTEGATLETALEWAKALPEPNLEQRALSVGMDVLVCAQGGIAPGRVSREPWKRAATSAGWPEQWKIRVRFSDDLEGICNLSNVQSLFLLIDTLSKLTVKEAQP